VKVWSRASQPSSGSCPQARSVFTMADTHPPTAPSASLPNNRTDVDGLDTSVTFKQAHRSGNPNSKIPHPVNIVIAFLDESKSVFQISVRPYQFLKSVDNHK